MNRLGFLLRHHLEEVKNQDLLVLINNIEKILGSLYAVHGQVQIGFNVFSKRLGM